MVGLPASIGSGDVAGQYIGQKKNWGLCGVRRRRERAGRTSFWSWGRIRAGLLPLDTHQPLGHLLGLPAC